MNGEPPLYDFRSPNRFSREQVRALQLVNETYARQLATVLSTTLRIVAHTSVIEVGPESYDEYTRAVPNPSLLAVLDFAPLSGSGLFQLPMGIVMGVIDRLLGGPGNEEQPERALSEIESGLVRKLVERMIHELAYSYESIAPFRAQVVSLESDAQFLQLAAPSETMMISRFEVRIGDHEAEATLCIPVETLMPVLDTLTVKPELELTGAKAVAAEELKDRVTEVPVDVRVSFRSVRLTSSEVFDLQPGDILPLRHATNQPLTIMADGVPVATAVPGSFGHRTACQIVSV